MSNLLIHSDKMLSSMKMSLWWRTTQSNYNNNKPQTHKQTLHNVLYKFIPLSWAAFLGLFSMLWPSGYGLDTPPSKEPQDIIVWIQKSSIASYVFNIWLPAGSNKLEGWEPLGLWPHQQKWVVGLVTKLYWFLVPATFTTGALLRA